jgi:hypothetical protein
MRTTMASNSASIRRGRKKLKVGDRVVLHLGARDVYAAVVEDRGPLAQGGRQLVSIRRLGVSPELSQPYEVPAEELELVEEKKD